MRRGPQQSGGLTRPDQFTFFGCEV
jgi:hypothetical protein